MAELEEQIRYLSGQLSAVPGGDVTEFEDSSGDEESPGFFCQGDEQK